LAKGNVVNGYTLLFTFDNTLTENIAENNHNIGFNLRDSTYANVLVSNEGCRNHTTDALDETAGENYWVDNDFCTGSFSPSGAISGQVTDQDGNPISGLNVTACTFHVFEPICGVGQTRDDGNYIIVGLPPEDYRVFVIEPGWAKKIYFDTHHWEDATPVPLELGTNTGGIDFILAPGGTISGHGTDMAGNPLENMSVDLEQGWYGACTDVNGFYIIDGVPLGAQNVVVGRDFCGPHGFAQQFYGVILEEASQNIVVNFVLLPAN
jgi:parallel beta-helix repeat protein